MWPTVDVEGSADVHAMRESLGLGRGKVGEVELGKDGAVEVTDCDDFGALVVGEIDEERFFGAEDEFYGVEAHGGGECRGSGSSGRW